MTVNKKYYEFFKINIINFIIILLFVFIGYFGKIKWLCYLPILIPYFIYLLSRKSSEVIKYQLSYLLISTAVLDNLFLKTSINIPFEIQYITEVISLILLIKIIINYKKYTKCIKDPIIILVTICILINLVVSSANNNKFLDTLTGLHMYYRFLPTYIIVSCNYIDFINDYKLYYIINIPIFIFQFILGFHQDNINGIFGARGGAAFSLFILIFLAMSLIKYLYKKVNLVTITFVIIGTIIMFVIQENKAFIFISIALILFVSLINNGKLYKKIVIIISSIVVFFIGINFVVIIYPEFSNMFSKDGYKVAIENYLIGNNNSAFALGRYEAGTYVINNELYTDMEKLLGRGMGTSLPNENWYFENKSMGREIFDTHKSTIFLKYGKEFGYHLSGFTTTIVDYGIIGIFIICSISIIILGKSTLLLLNGYKIEEKSIGATGIIVFLASLFPMTYGSAFMERVFNFILLLICSYVTYQYKVSIECNRNINKKV